MNDVKSSRKYAFQVRVVQNDGSGCRTYVFSAYWEDAEQVAKHLYFHPGVKIYVSPVLK